MTHRGAGTERVTEIHTTPERLVCWVPGILVNPLNKREHWGRRASRTRRTRDAVCLAVWQALDGRRILAPAARPKVISFHAHVGRQFDDDGLTAALKAHRDGLQDCGLIDADAPSRGHVFHYAQTGGVPSAQQGVVIVVCLRDPQTVWPGASQDRVCAPPGGAGRTEPGGPGG